MTDQVLHVARYNAERNFEPAELERRVRLHELRWGDEAGLKALGDEAFDLILGSDIIYHAEHHNVLAETMAALAKPGSVALLCTLPPTKTPTAPPVDAAKGTPLKTLMTVEPTCSVVPMSGPSEVLAVGAARDLFEDEKRKARRGTYPRASEPKKWLLMESKPTFFNFLEARGLF